MIELAEYLREIGYQPEQVQDFYPTPGTLSTTMYHTGLDPLTMKEVYVPKDRHEKAMQRALLQFRNPKHYDLVCEALVKADREDLIGFGVKCLVKPRVVRYKSDSGKERNNDKNIKSKKSVIKDKGKDKVKQKGSNKPNNPKDKFKTSNNDNNKNKVESKRR
jgi:hypothetical protein